MKVLIGCERSGVLRRALVKRGHDVISCDLFPADDGANEDFQEGLGRHATMDIFDLLGRRYDWADAAFYFPDCTFLTGAGLHWNKRRPEREQKTAEAIRFVQRIWSFPIKRKALENPVGCLSTRWRPVTQTIQPYDCGDDASKRTCLWLEGFKRKVVIDPAKRFPGRLVEWPRGSGKMVERWSNQTDSGQNKLTPSADRAQKRSETYPGIADALAELLVERQADELF